MEYTDCYICDLGPLAQLLFLALLALVAFVAVRSRVWTLVASLSAVPIAEWYMEGIPSALAAAAAVLIGSLVALMLTRNRKGRSPGSGLTSA
jgi:hypothetical protein